MRKLLLATAAAMVITAAIPAMSAEEADATGKAGQIPAFGDFIASVRSAEHRFATGDAASEAASSEMRAHIVKSYEHVDPRQVRHSFADDNDSVFDCIPVGQQPALRGSAQPIPTAPDLPRAGAGRAGGGGGRDLPAAQLSQARHDRHGNAMACDRGTIPMMRMTPEGLARFDSLRSFFRKSPVGIDAAPPDGRPSGEARAAAAATHRYAHAYQRVANLGGHSFLNIWKPPVGANQIFSLSQQWYAGGSGSGLQTVEAGWQVYPQFYKTTNPVFFIYYTADGYTRTGCYNLSCGAFVQTSGSVAIGGSTGPVSVLNGAQYAREVAYYLSGGRWWLYVNGTSSGNAVGYYPASLFGSGALSRAASSIDYGGETVGTTSWPPMGSGMFANAGFGRAAYQRSIYYYPTSGGAVHATLTPSQNWPSQYTVLLQNFGAPWNRSFFFGGPGGR